MPRASYIGITVSMVLLVLMLVVLLPLPQGEVALPLNGLGLGLALPPKVVVAVVLVALAAAGMDAVTRPLFAPAGQLGRRIPLWVLPGFVSVAGLVSLSDLWWGYQLIVVGLTGLALTAVMVAEFHATYEQSRYQRIARLIVQVLAYVAAMVLFSTLYATRMRGALLGSGTLLLGGGLALVLLSSENIQPRHAWRYASVIGLCMGELTLALNYYLLKVPVAGALLLVLFYTLTGLAQQHLWQRLTRRVVLEYVLVAVVGLVTTALLNRMLAG